MLDLELEDPLPAGLRCAEQDTAARLVPTLGLPDEEDARVDAADEAGIRSTADALGVPLVTWPATRLATVDVPHPSTDLVIPGGSTGSTLGGRLAATGQVCLDGLG